MTVKERAYITTVHVKFVYCSSVWDPCHHKHVNQLDMVQRSAARSVMTKLHRRQDTTSVTDMVHQLKCQPTEKDPQPRHDDALDHQRQSRGPCLILPISKSWGERNMVVQAPSVYGGRLQILICIMTGTSYWNSSPELSHLTSSHSDSPIPGTNRLPRFLYISVHFDGIDGQRCIISTIDFETSYPGETTALRFAVYYRDPVFM